MNVPPNNRLTKASAKSSAPPPSARSKANEAFDQEVDEAMQQDQWARLWEKYSGYILAGAAAIVLGVGGYKFMESRRIASQEAAGARYVAAAKQLAEAKSEDAGKGLQAIAAAGGGAGALAQLRLAGADAAAGKTADALAKYAAVTRLSNLDPVLADYARLQSAILQLDTAPWADLQKWLTPLTADNNAWRFAAREALGLGAFKAGNRGEARANFEKLISEQGVPSGMAERARIVMGSIAAAELAEKSPAPQQAPATPETPAPVTAPAPTAAPPAAQSPPPPKKK